MHVATALGIRCGDRIPWPFARFALPSAQFAFDTEFTLLDVGATGALIRSGGVRPSVVAYDAEGGVDTVVLEWAEDADAAEVFEETRRWLRDRNPVAYGVVALLRRQDGELRFLRAEERGTEGDLLGLCLCASDGQVRGVLYPVRTAPTGPMLCAPSQSDRDNTDWCPIGDIWSNPYCVGDTVGFRPPERAVDPETPLWKAIVDLTKLRVQTDRFRSQEYMLFLDDLRNGIFTVVGRSPVDPMQVALKPRTVYNPLGYVVVHASKLRLIEGRTQTVGEGWAK